jgi:hypothetical protein
MNLELIQSITSNYPPDSFLPLYQNLLLQKKDVDMNILELPIPGDGSIKLWNQFFKNIPNDWRDVDTSSDAFNSIQQFQQKNIKFDLVLINNSSHIENICSCVELYAPLLANKSVLAIENVLPTDVESICAKVPESIYNYIKNYQLNTTNTDTVIFTIDKSNLQL